MEIIEERPELKSKNLKLDINKLVRCSTPGNHKKTILVEYQKLREKFTIESIKILTDEILKRLQYIIDSFAISEEYKQIEKLLQDPDTIDTSRLGLIVKDKYYQIEQLKIKTENINVLKDEERLQVTTILENILRNKQYGVTTINIENKKKLNFTIDALRDIESMKEKYLTTLQDIMDLFDISEENKQVTKSLQKIISDGNIECVQDEYNNLSKKIDEIVNEIIKSQELKQETQQENETIKTYTKRIGKPSRIGRTSRFKRKF